MKKGWTWVLLIPLLTACAAQPVYETVEDVWDEPAMAQARQVQLMLPEDAAAPVLQRDDHNQVYLCQGYELRLETVPGGDLTGTLLDVTGRKDLAVMETRQDGLTRYDCAWTATGEEEEQVAHTVVLDDGTYHYCLTALWDASATASVQKEVNDLLSQIALA